MRARLIILVAIAFSALTNCAPDPEVLTGRRIAAVQQGLVSDYSDPPWRGMDLEERMEYYRVPGVSIAVINGFQIEWARGYGVPEVGEGEPVTPDTLFQTGSIAKPVVAVAALHYVEEGALELDRDVNDSLVSWKVPENEFTAKASVTLRRLLSHSGGVTVEGFRGYALGEEVPSLWQVLNGEWPANSPPIRVDTIPGTQYRYSGGGYVIVQQLLEDVAGQPFPEIVRSSVLAPWGMTASTFKSPLPEDLEEMAASGYRADGSTIPGGWHTYPEMGSGASMWATPSDMARFAIEVMQAYRGRSDAVLSHDMAIQMLTPQIGDRGLGPVLGDDGGDLFYFMHPGSNDGFKSVMVGYPERGQGVVIMTNGDNGDALWREILNGVSIEYGWVRNYTYLYVGIAVAIVVVLLGIVTLGRARARHRSVG